MLQYGMFVRIQTLDVSRVTVLDKSTTDKSQEQGHSKHVIPEKKLEFFFWPSSAEYTHNFSPLHQGICMP